MFGRIVSPKGLVPFAAGAALGLACFFGGTQNANAQVYVYAPGPPPPPPPPPPRYVYVREPEPSNALVIAADFEGAIPLNMQTFGDGNNIQGGGGFKVRIGERLRLVPGVHLTPEVGYAYMHLFAADDSGDAFDWDLHRVFAGARLSFGSIVVPVIYAHAGYGWRDTGDPTVASNSGFAYDVGGALDFRRFRHFVVGAHVEYAGMQVQPYSPEWLALGVHAEIIL